MTATDTLLNRVFDGRYLIRRRLGSGGMADVYLAEDQELGRQVALKMLNERHASDEGFVERFRHEAKSAAGLNHPNIVSIFDRGQAEGTYYIAMEFLDGRTLKELLIKNGPTPIPIAIDYARQILNALAFSHRNGIVHRDIKPHNVVVGPDGRLKVTDFGIARSEASQMTEAGSIVGTAQYLSPEQARGAQVDPRSDLYSLGILLYEMLTAKVPFAGDAPVEIAMKHLQAIPEPPSTIREEIPHELDAVVMRALAKDPEDRYQSAEEMEADLARVARGVAVSPRTEEAMTQVLAGAGIVAAPARTMVTRLQDPEPPAPPATPPPGPYYGYSDAPRRRSPWPWLLGALALVIAAGAGYLLYQKIQNQLNETKPIGVVDVVRLREGLARQKLEDEGFVVSVRREASDVVPPGSVVEQDPAGGDRAAKGSTVSIYVSSGKAKTTVPSVKGFSLAQAISTLADAGLKTNPVSLYSAAPENTVTAEDPKAGAIVLVGSTVRINVSKGVKPRSVPDVVGQPFGSAAAALKSGGFVVDRTDVDSEVPKGQVVAQDPLAGGQAAQGAHVALSVSKGPQVSQVPDVTGQAPADAEALLKSAGYRSTEQPREVTDPANDGIVLAQRPPGGKIVKKDTLVTLVVGKLAAPAPDAAPDTTAPVIGGLPADIVSTATGPAGATVDYTMPIATDAVDGARPVSCTPPTGSTFPVGETTVVCTTSDTHGNAATATFKVKVQAATTTSP